MTNLHFHERPKYNVVPDLGIDWSSNADYAIWLQTQSAILKCHEAETQYLIGRLYVPVGDVRMDNEPLILNFDIDYFLEFLLIFSEEKLRKYG